MPKSRDCIPRSAGPVLLLSTAFLQFAILAGISIYILVSTSGSDGSLAVALGSPFIFYLAIDGHWKQNSLQLFTILGFNFWLLVYLIINLVENVRGSYGVGILATGEPESGIGFSVAQLM